MRVLRFLAIWMMAEFLFLQPSFPAESWLELKGEHFIIYYLGDEEFAKDVSRSSERYYSQIADDLGYARHSDFWQWDKRVKIYIHATQEEFLKETGRNNWSHGFADYIAKEIHSYAWNEGFLQSLLPHEITHLIFRDYVGFKGEVPLWLDEGVAQWEEPEKRKIVKEVMQSYLMNDYVYPIQHLCELDIRNVTVEFAVQLFYVQSISVIEFLVTRYGTDKFITFCRELRDGKSLEVALKFSYPTQIKDLSELEEQWKNYVLKTP